MEKSFYVEIRSAVGGIESTLFAEELLTMYLKYCKRKKLKHKLVSINLNAHKGVDDAAIYIEGEISFFQNESGVHKVQRNSKTSKNEKRHTSTVTVAIIPKIQKNVIEINKDDLIIKTFKASGNGGQHVNKTESAIRITHKPTNLSIVCQSERSQHSNKEIALDLLYAKLNQMERNKQKKSENTLRFNQVSNGSRSECVRTYNYIRSEVINHANGKKVNLEKFMDGNLENII